MDDLKHFRAPPALPEDAILLALIAIIFACWLADRMGWLS